jgi:hypothetical protein
MVVAPEPFLSNGKVASESSGPRTSPVLHIPLLSSCLVPSLALPCFPQCPHEEHSEHLLYGTEQPSAFCGEEEQVACGISDIED